MANKAYYKRQLNDLKRKNNAIKNIDAIVMVFSENASCVITDTSNNKTAVVLGPDDVAYFRKRLERVFKDCLEFKDSADYE